MASQPAAFLTPEQYLALERKAERKSEYYRGEMFLMSGGSERHNLTAGNLFANLWLLARPRGCRVYGSDMRVRADAHGLYTYPDVTVVCGKPVFADEHSDTLTNPRVIIEVLSPSTEAYDRGRKFVLYQAIESLAEYVLVAQDRVQIDHMVRQPDGQWLVRTLTAMADVLRLQTVPCEIAVSEIYSGVEWEETGG